MSLPAARADEGIARALLRAQPQRFARQPLTATMFANVRARAHATLALAFALLALAALLTALIGDAPLSRHLSSRFWVAGQRSLLKWLTDAGLYAGYACFIASCSAGGGVSGCGSKSHAYGSPRSSSAACSSCAC